MVRTWVFNKHEIVQKIDVALVNFLRLDTQKGNFGDLLHIGYLLLYNFNSIYSNIFKLSRFVVQRCKLRDLLKLYLYLVGVH